MTNDTMHEGLQKRRNPQGGYSQQVGGKTVTVQASFTRPADATTYDIGDVVAGDPAAILEFTDCAMWLGGSGVIISLVAVDSVKATPLPKLRVWIVKDDAVGTDADNTIWTPTDAELKKVIGVVDLDETAWSEGNGNCVQMVTGLNIPFVCEEDDDNLYAIVTALNAYVPASGEEFTLTLGILPD